MKRITELCGLQSFVKIGGCEAKTDLYNCVKLGVNGVIAPMIETPFALLKFNQIINDFLYSKYKTFLQNKYRKIK